MSSPNSTYEERITCKENEERITTIDHVRSSVWKECLISEAGLSIEMAREMVSEIDKKGEGRVDYAEVRRSKKYSVSHSALFTAFFPAVYFAGHECTTLSSCTEPSTCM